jgi:hypothetical protein
MRRRLTLRSESLTELTHDDLTAVQGGIPPLTENPTLCVVCAVPTNGCTSRVTEQTCTW